MPVFSFNYFVSTKSLIDARYTASISADDIFDALSEVSITGTADIKYNTLISTVESSTLILFNDLVKISFTQTVAIDSYVAINDLVAAILTGKYF